MVYNYIVNKKQSTFKRRKAMKTYRVYYDTENSTNNIFEVEAMFEQDAWDAFYYEVETEQEVTYKAISII